MPRRKAKKRSLSQTDTRTDESAPPKKKSKTENNNSENKEEKEEEQKECCICLNPIDLPIILPCKHEFCHLCVKDVRTENEKTKDEFSDEDNSDSDSNSDDDDDKLLFTCPYCRAKTDVKAVDKAKISVADATKQLSKNQTKSDDNTNNTNNNSNDVITWQYSGKSGGWWSYTPSHNKKIEKRYQKYMGNDDSNNDDDDNNDDLEDYEYLLEIGYNEYIIDFKKLVQYKKDDKFKKRKIRRHTFDPSKKIDLKKTDSWKGVGGQFFDKKKN